MRQTIVISLLVLAVAFSLLNVEPLTIELLFWRVDTVVAVAVIVALAIGIVVGAVLMLPWGLRARRALAEARRQLAGLEQRAGRAAGARQTPAAGDPED
jgi:uncharacterized integral membrane protein